MSLPHALGKPVVRLRSTSDQVDPRTLEPGRDLVLDMPRAQGKALPFGVLLDDRLSPEARDAIDREASDRLSAWRERRDGELTLDGVCLPQIWEVELLAEVFLPETRIVSGLRRALEVSEPRRLECEGLDDGRIVALTATLESLGIEVASLGAHVPPPRYPSALAAPWRISWSTRVATASSRSAGVPQSVRGDVFLLPYWHLVPVFERLALAHSLSPVIDLLSYPQASLRTLFRAAARGGWVGRPGVVARRRSRRQLERALAPARKAITDSDALGTLLDDRALAMLEQRAGDTLAAVTQLRKAFSRRSVKVAVLPFDSPPDARVVVQAARESAVPTLVVQHGFVNESNDPDQTFADAVAVWSEADSEHLKRRTSAFVAVTGNPGAATVTDPNTTKSRAVGRSIILVEYASRLSVRVDSRVSLRHVTTALCALEMARPGTAVTIRPHPAEHEPEIFEELAFRHEELLIDVDTASPIAELFEAADLCIGAVSTATLQAAAAQVPVVFLNVTGRAARFPFNGSSGVPVASTAEELATLIPHILSIGSVLGRSEMLDALGVDADALDNVIGLIEKLADESRRDGSPTRTFA